MADEREPESGTGPEYGRRRRTRPGSGGGDGRHAVSTGALLPAGAIRLRRRPGKQRPPRGGQSPAPHPYG